MIVVHRFSAILGFMCIVCLPWIDAQLIGFSARSLDAVLQDYAFRAFTKPRTGIVYNGSVPSNLTGILISALRLRSGSLRTKGFDRYNEFQIPTGVSEQPYVERLVLVYHNLGNWSSLYYPLPGYAYLAPVLGLLAYNASNLTATNLPELQLRTSDKPMLVKFPSTKAPPDGLSAKCVYFDLHGSVEFDNVLSGNVCSATQQGHFSIIVESSAPSPAPSSEDSFPSFVGSEKFRFKTWMIVCFSLVGGFALVVLLCLLVVLVKGCRRGKKMKQMEWAAEGSEALQMTSIGTTKAPLAMGTRTRPLLENEYVI